MSRTGRNSARHRAAGFTLIEVVCVVAIVALIAGLGLPTPALHTSRMGLEQLAMRAAAILEADRYAAARGRKPVTTIIDARAREVRSGAGGRALRAPADVTLAADVSGKCPLAPDGAGIGFYPDGRSCGGVISFKRDGAGFETRVSWLTGGVEIVATP